MIDFSSHEYLRMMHAVDEVERFRNMANNAGVHLEWSHVWMTLIEEADEAAREWLRSIGK